MDIKKLFCILWYLIWKQNRFSESAKRNESTCELSRYRNITYQIIFFIATINIFYWFIHWCVLLCISFVYINCVCVCMCVCLYVSSNYIIMYRTKGKYVLALHSFQEPCCFVTKCIHISVCLYEVRKKSFHKFPCNF